LVRFSTLAMPAITSIAVLFGSATQAMDVQAFERMSVNDQADYTGLMGLMPAFWLTRFSWLLSAATMFTNAVAGLVILSACASAAMAADDPPPPKPAATNAAPATSAGKPMITHNPDGTFTVQKESNRTTKDAKVTNGLEIPPQVVTPIFSTPDKK
jgi:hypothetical protein